ncbi:MAG: Clp protease N-terminal domain-containing protein [Thermoanaerobaculia bacterium]
MLVALVRQDGGIVGPILTKLGANPAQIEMQLSSELAKRARVGEASAEPTFRRSWPRRLLMFATPASPLPPGSQLEAHALSSGRGAGTRGRNSERMPS